MRSLVLAIVASLSCGICLAESPALTFKKLRLSDKFYCEGAYYADFNKDGHLDVVAGPYWYEGPDFQKRHEIYPPKAFDPKEYSNDFLTFTADFNGDGWPDILYVPFPGGEAYWYENPAGKDRPWKKHFALKDVGNESPAWADVNGDGRPELIYNQTGRLGYATYDPAKPDQPWVFHPISPRRNYYERFTHGLGYGDINGDGRIDLVERLGWWEQPAAAKPGEHWIWHPFYFADAASQMLVYDVDGDGLADIVTAWNCHGYGLLWYKQIRNAKGEITWQKHEILPPTPTMKPNELRFSQPHAMYLADVNGDGLMDFVTGKRFWAHGPNGDVEPNAPAVLYWFELQRDKSRGVRFIPHQIDNDSGVGTQVTAVDLNGDGIADVIVGNKKGTFVFLSQRDKPATVSHKTGSAAAVSPVKYPGPAPGKAAATVSGDRLRLENAVLAIQWEIKDGRLFPNGITDKQSGTTTPKGGELFSLALADGKTVRASDLALTTQEGVAPIALPDGKSFTAAFLSGDDTLRVGWQAVLHDDANYVVEELTIEPLGKDLALDAVVPIDLPLAGAKQIGEVPGSPVTAGNLFLACANPLAANDITASAVRCRLPHRSQVKAGESYRCRAVIGVASPGQMRRAFLRYIERERPRPYQPFLHYNSWYDIAWGNRKFNEAQSLDAIGRIGRELVERRGVTLDSLVFDDGWDDDRTLWRFHRGFPNGFTPLAQAAARYHSAVGTWLSPWGGYGEANSRRLKYGRAQGFETNANGFALAGPKYYARFRAVCIEMMKKYGVNYFKFDGVGSGNTEPGHPYAALSAEATADLEALLRLTADLRRVRPEVFINITTGTWPSPFWLLHGDSIWRNGADMGFSGEGSRRQQWLNYRDAVTRQMVAARGPLFPLNSIMNQGITHAREAASLGDDLQELKDDFRMFFADGTQLQELYITPAMLTPKMWDALAEAANWSRANADVLVDTHWIGGDPNRGEVYGYASWSPRKGIVALRNPSRKPASFALDLAAALELPAPCDYTLKSPWREDADQPAIAIPAGQRHRFELKPFEVLVLEAVPGDA